MANPKLSRAKLKVIRAEYRQRNIRVKYPRQKIKSDYQSIYPWILPDEVDPYYVFCTLCECRLSAKRSDLGKHEGSIKHRENANKKSTVNNSITLKGATQQAGTASETDPTLDSVLSWNGDDVDDDKSVIYDDNNKEIQIMNLEPVVDLIENSYDLTLDNDSCGDNDNDDSRDSDAEIMVKSNIKPPSSESDSISQHSNALDYLPIQVTISEASTSRPHFTFSSLSTIANSRNNSTQGTLYNNTNSINYPSITAANTATTPQTPCKITIKKITAPLPPAPLPSQIKSTATITPVLSTITTPAQFNNVSQQSNTANSINASSKLLLRDSYELFFDSICATVKSLPPLLATEGKMRVMQLIGELEMRAILEREQKTQTNSTTPQSSTVASTTK